MKMLLLLNMSLTVKVVDILHTHFFFSFPASPPQGRKLLAFAEFVDVCHRKLGLETLPTDGLY